MLYVKLEQDFAFILEGFGFKVQSIRFWFFWPVLVLSFYRCWGRFCFHFGWIWLQALIHFDWILVHPWNILVQFWLHFCFIQNPFWFHLDSLEGFCRRKATLWDGLPLELNCGFHFHFVLRTVGGHQASQNLFKTNRKSMQQSMGRSVWLFTIRRYNCCVRR